MNDSGLILQIPGIIRHIESVITFYHFKSIALVRRNIQIMIDLGNTPYVEYIPIRNILCFDAYSILRAGMIKCQLVSLFRQNVFF